MDTSSIQEVFQITYQPIGSSEDVRQLNVSSTESMVQITELFPGFKYTYEIVAISGGQLSDPRSATAVQSERKNTQSLDA